MRMEMQWFVECKHCLFIPCDSHGIKLLIKDLLQTPLFQDTLQKAQKIVKASREVQRKGYEEKWLAEAADDLGVDTDEIDKVVNSKGYVAATHSI